VRRKDQIDIFSRRTFLRGMQWAPLLFLPAPLHGLTLPSLHSGIFEDAASAFPFADSRLSPHYPAKSPLDDVLRQVVPGADEYVTEKYAFEIMRLLNEWSRALREASPALSVLAEFLSASIESASLVPSQVKTRRSGNGFEVQRRQFSASVASGRERFLREIKSYLAPIVRVETAEFEITGIEEITGELENLRVDIRYDFVGTTTDTRREERIGLWRTHWQRDRSNSW